MKKKGKKEIRGNNITNHSIYSDLGPETSFRLLALLSAPDASVRPTCAGKKGFLRTGLRNCPCWSKGSERGKVGKMGRYYQAPKCRLGHANESGGMFLFISDVKNCPVGPVG
jgi:hypothetical protein